MAKARAPLEEQVRRRIRELRSARGLTQEEVCERAGISSDAVTRIEGGSRVPTLDTLDRLAGAFGVSPAAFFQGTSPPVRDRNPIVGRVEGLLSSEATDVQELALELVAALVRALRKRRGPR